MKPRIITGRNSTLFATATQDELDVAEILLDLENIIKLSKSKQPSLEEWGRMGRRRMRNSSLVEGASDSGESSSQSTSIERTENEIEEGTRSEIEASPITPFDLLPSDLNEKTEYCTQILENRAKEKCIDMLEALTLSKDLVGAEQKTCRRKKQSNMKTSPHGITVGPHHRSLISDRTLHESPQLCSCSPPLGLVNHVRPLGISDLNISADEAFGVDQSQPLDKDNMVTADTGAKFAEARRTRRGMIKIRAMKSACGFRVKQPNFRK